MLLLAALLASVLLDGDFSSSSSFRTQSLTVFPVLLWQYLTSSWTNDRLATIMDSLLTVMNCLDLGTL